MAGGQRSERWKREVGRRLKAVRIAAGYSSAREIAQDLGVKENRYTNWERGLRLVEPEVMAKVKRLTGATADYIYYGDSSGLSKILAKKLGID